MSTPRRIFYTNLFSGTIACDFDQDWCNFKIQNTGDDNSKKGFAWQRRSANSIKNNGLEGPETGIIPKVYLFCKYCNIF